MDLTPYVENLRGKLAVAAEAGGDEARALAERLTAPLDSAIRLMLLDALSAAADDITLELAPGSVELRLRSGEPDFVVTPAPADDPPEPRRPPPRRPKRTRARWRASTSACPSSSKPSVEQAAARERLSVNAWLVRAAAAAVANDDRDRRPPGARWPDRPGLHRMGAMTFDTPEPISATITVVIGDVRISAGDRDTTAVEVQPSDPSNGEDRKAAEQTVVEYANGQLHVKAPKLRSWLPGSTPAGRST